jgi:hypothetical protein
MAKAKPVKKASPSKKTSNSSEKRGKEVSKKAPKAPAKGPATHSAGKTKSAKELAKPAKGAKLSSSGHKAQGGAAQAKLSKNTAKADRKMDGKASPKASAKSETSETSKLAKPAKGKAKKKIEQDDDLLAGEADGSDESIEGLDEIEEFDAEILEAESAEPLVEIVVEETEVLLAPGSEDSEEIVLTDAEGRRLCQVRDCDQAASVESYCRFHYLQNWKRIQVRRKILADGKLERYVDELTSRYPDKFLEMIRKDVRTEKDFLAAIAELEIDESGLDNEFEDESQSFIEEVRGVTEAGISDEEEF